MKRDWTAGPIAVALCAALVAAGALWLSWDRWPVGTAQISTGAVVAALCTMAATRNLRARLEATQQVVDAWNSSEARDELAKSPPAGTPTVELYDQDADPFPIGITAQGGPIDPRLFHLNAERYDLNEDRAAWSALGLPDVEMSVAETDRLIANLQALPGEAPTVCPGSDTEAAGDGAAYKYPEGMCLVCEQIVGLVEGVTEEHNWPYDHPAPVGHLGQPCATCDAPATSWVSERPDPEISDVTFLCDGHYAERMSEEDGRG